MAPDCAWLAGAVRRSVTTVLRLLVSPRWLGRHLLLVVAVCCLLLLGRWQWTRGTADHDLRNLLYGIQWWIFAGLACYGWFRALRGELRPGPPEAPAAQPPILAAGGTSPVIDEDDEELVAYNRYLAALHARSLREPQR